MKTMHKNDFGLFSFTFTLKSPQTVSTSHWTQKQKFLYIKGIIPPCEWELPLRARQKLCEQVQVADLQRRPQADHMEQEILQDMQ
jgi:hypothetical protein